MSESDILSSLDFYRSEYFNMSFILLLMISIKREPIFEVNSVTGKFKKIFYYAIIHILLCKKVHVTVNLRFSDPQQYSIFLIIKMLSILQNL